MQLGQGFVLKHHQARLFENVGGIQQLHDPVRGGKGSPHGEKVLDEAADPPVQGLVLIRHEPGRHKDKIEKHVRLIDQDPYHQKRRGCRGAEGPTLLTDKEGGKAAKTSHQMGPADGPGDHHLGCREHSHQGS